MHETALIPPLPLLASRAQERLISSRAAARAGVAQMENEEEEEEKTDVFH